MEAQDQELIKYKNIKHFIYDTDNDRGGMFVSLGIFGSIFNAIL